MREETGGLRLVAIFGERERERRQLACRARQDGGGDLGERAARRVLVEEVRLARLIDGWMLIS